MTISALALLATSSFAADVLVIHAVPDPNYGTDVVNKLRGTGRFGAVDEWNGMLSVPTTQDLRNYDAVFLMPDAGYADPTTLGNNLVTYVDAGGGVVDSVFSVGWGALYVGGDWFNNSYRPFEGSTQGNITGNMVPVVRGHAMLTGVSEFGFNQSGYYSPGVFMNPNATLVAEWTDGTPLLAEARPSRAGTVVGLNAYMPSADAAPWFGWQATLDGATLMANALEYAISRNVRSLIVDTSGTCPGQVRLAVYNATANGQIALATGTTGGTTRLPGGPCAGTVVPLTGMRLRATPQADAQGTLQVTFNPPGGLCGSDMIALDMTSCELSNLSWLQ